jgi:HEAT repeat protein
MKSLRILVLRGLFLILLASGAALDSVGQASADDVEKALAFLRQINPAKVTSAQEEDVAKQINAAWETIHKAGANGRARLKEEIARPGQSDYFKLNGAALLWQLGGLDEAETIASVWRSTRLEVQSNYVFYPAFAAAQKHDEKALPMLLVVLGNNLFQIYVVTHAMDVKWPLTIHFIWGAYGPKGLPVLLKVLKETRNPVESQSAIFIFANDQFLDALPKIRELARQSDQETRRAAIYALGFFGHPEDYDFLIAGLRSPDAEDRFYYAMAVYEYEDLRAVPHLIPLLDDRNQKVRREAFANLTHLLTAESLDSLINYARRARGEEKTEANEYLESELREYGLNLSGYQKKSPAARAQTIDSVRRQREAGRFMLQPGEKGFTHDELIKAAEQWKKNHRMPVEARQILTAATANDIDLLLEVKAALFARLSDECLYEVKRIDMAVRRLGRSRYRKDVGITERVEPR